jgi:hypothetical protein
MASRKKNTPAVQQTSPVVESEQTCQVEKVECPPELGPMMGGMGQGRAPSCCRWTSQAAGSQLTCGLLRRVRDVA